MKKFKTIFIVLLIVKSIYGYSQDYKSEIQNRFNDYGKTIIEKKYKETVDEFWFEGFLDEFTKEGTLNVLYETYENPDLEIKIDKFSTNEVNNLEIIDGREYAFLTYFFDCEIRVKAKIELDDEFIQKVITFFNDSYEEISIEFKKNENKFIFKANRKALAIKNKSKKKWEFLMADKNNALVFTNILPESILKQF